MLERHYSPYGDGLMAKNDYQILLLPRAVRDLDDIYEYIVNSFEAMATANKLLDSLEEAIMSLADFPERCPERKVGRFAYQGYRQLFVNNYTIIYRIEEREKRVLVYTVRYIRSDF